MRTLALCDYPLCEHPLSERHMPAEQDGHKYSSSSNDYSSDDLGMSMILGLASDNFIVGGLIGGDFTGAMIGDILSDGSLF